LCQVGLQIIIMIFAKRDDDEGEQLTPFEVVAAVWNKLCS
jgi:hypothetical protein